MNATVIIPTYREQGNIERIIAEVLQQGPEFRVLVVDDCSPDQTASLARAMIPRYPRRLRVVRRRGPRGLGNAYVYGFTMALEDGADYIFEMDADFSHPPRFLPSMLRAAQSADLVIGSRYVPGGLVTNWPVDRRWISRLGNLYARTILSVSVRDITAGYKCYRREALRQIDHHSLRSTGYAFQIETTYRVLRAGLKVEEVPIEFVERVEGDSKMSKAIMGEAARMVWHLRWKAPAVLPITPETEPSGRASSGAGNSSLP